MVVRLRLSGEVGRDVALLFLEQLASVEADEEGVSIEMDDAEINDPAVLAQLVGSLREVAARVKRLSILHPPQALAHGLYRISAIGSIGQITVIEPRIDLGTAS